MAEKPRAINMNAALNTSLYLEIPGMEEINYFVQNAEIPGMQMVGVDSPYQKHGTNVPSNRIEYDPFNCVMIVDEDMRNFEMMKEWFERVRDTEPVIDELKTFTLHMTTSRKTANVQIVFHGAYPTLVGAMTVNSDASETNPIVCSLSFRYQYYEIKRNK
ncbi:hypothetical protein CPT_Mendera_018 [Stenotrophomonas phage Mendera]|uniref:Uncharacterized protein n=2 Tax=Menderavirus TaxID=2843421 RepID=A0A5P8PIK8_9CAUD|nr:hypothetical protein HWC60_gp018 [Stenotrophomonas phage Mendera]YP_010667596.1 tail tube [Stenotrophomonas maltophilia phage vB_SmaM_Ps15]QXN67393.1 hypothetical protein [Stenotrophomonas phage BUCT608]QYW02565.1 tail completion protein [Stenotrophomonas phage Marzo]QFR56567.1 hypothetical protein CPT_Mendera_018 [Stenotrophomonas phage Mendera]QYC97531.1 hypothetical protein [Stenotrophomonas phage BUCT608]UMO77268.1 tail completion and sheath stabilizer protein [Stenotrophomonas maltoph